MRLTFILLAGISAWAQPRIGIIDIYGRNKVSEAQIRKTLGVKEGDALPRSKGAVEEALEALPNVVSAQLEAACCEDGKAILYVGIEEKGAPHLNFHDEPAGEVRLPDEIHKEYEQFLASVGLAVRAGVTGEDLSNGHSLMSYEPARGHQERFLDLAKDNLANLKDVLRNSADSEHRAIAAYVIGYAPGKKDVIGDLQYALLDEDNTVRNNAMRSLGAFAVLASREPERGISVSPTWFVEMLSSLMWQDRATAAVTLVTLTEKRDARTLDLVRERAMPVLAEMARWKHLAHALPSFILIGRAAGIPEPEIQVAWAKGDREAFLNRAYKPQKK